MAEKNELERLKKSVLMLQEELAEGKGTDKLKKSILILQEEVERLSQPPFVSGTVLALGKKTARVSIDNSGVYEIPSDEGLKKKVKKGSRVVLHPQTKAIVGYSEFKTACGETSVVEEVSEERLKIQIKGESKYVLNGLKDVKEGDEIMLDPTGVLAIEKFERKKTKYALQEVPNSPWEKIGGLENVISKIKGEVEDPFIHRKIFAKYGRTPAKGILLYGPPGCGKTMIAKSIAYNLSKIAKTKDAKGYFIRINGPEILDKWVGNSEQNIRRIYAAARETAEETKGPVIVFIDEAESVLKSRGQGISTDVYDSIVPQFLSEMDGLNGNGNVITILATNREDIIDPAILRDGRVDRRIKIPRPNEEATKQIFNIYLKDKPLQKKSFKGASIEQISGEISSKIYNPKNILYSLISPQKGVLGNFHYRHVLSGALIKGIVDRACSYAIKRELKGGKGGLCQQDLAYSINSEFKENTGFSQTLVKEDWEEVFGSQGKMYKEFYKTGAFVLENMTNGTHTQHKLQGGKAK
ncbi:AAA family ATPase [Nanoarchaeota archaeon]